MTLVRCAAESSIHSLVSEPIWKVKIGSSPGCKDHALEESAVLRDIGQEKSKIWTLNFKKAHFQLFKELNSRIPGETALGDKRVKKIFEDAFHRVQEIVILRCKARKTRDNTAVGK